MPQSLRRQNQEDQRRHPSPGHPFQGGLEDLLQSPRRSQQPQHPATTRRVTQISLESTGGSNSSTVLAPCHRNPGMRGLVHFSSSQEDLALETLRHISIKLDGSW